MEVLLNTKKVIIYFSQPGAESVMSTSGPAEQEDLMAQPPDDTQLGAAAATTESSSSDVCNTNNRTVRYLKLIGMAAAFSLAALGVKKVMENFSK